MASLPFIGDIAPHRPALRDDTLAEWLTYGDLRRLAVHWAGRLVAPRGLVFLYASNDHQSVAALIGALAAGHAVALFDPHLPQSARARLAEIYRPRWIVGPQPDGLTVLDATAAIHPALAVLLSTSGSTGSAKLVRLTLPGLEANASGIGDVLRISSEDVAAGYLPIHYSYGLSVLTSHLARGARVRLTSLRLTDRGFWQALRESSVTHMPGVPFHYHIMLKLGLQRLGLPALRTMTQAGGALDLALRRQAHEFMHGIGGRFFVLYGQTEAGPRMTTLQHEDFPAAPGSVGTALPSCRLEIIDPDVRGHGEVVFFGPNVMMGYAETAADLARGDDMKGRLPTGDLGMLDDHGRLTIVGRVKRMSKLYGLRINLDDIETTTNECAATAVTHTGESLTIHVATTGDADADQAIKHTILQSLRERFTIPTTSYRFRIVPVIPRTERGKVDYPALEALE